MHVLTGGFRSVDELCGRILSPHIYDMLVCFYVFVCAVVKSLVGLHGEISERVAYAGLWAIASLAFRNAANCSSLGEQGACAGACVCEEGWKAVGRSDEVMLCMNGVVGCCIATKVICSVCFRLHIRCVHGAHIHFVRD